MAVVESVRFEHHREPLGIGERRPRVSWKVTTDVAGWTQSAYEIEVGTWSSGRVESAESVLVGWEAPELRSRERRSVRVRVWGAGRRERVVAAGGGRGRAARAGRLDGGDDRARAGPRGRAPAQ